MHKNDTRHYYKMENSVGNKQKSDKRRPNENAIKQFRRQGALGGHKLIKYLTCILYNIQHKLISPILRILIIFFKCIVLDSLRLTCFFLTTYALSCDLLIKL